MSLVDRLQHSWNAFMNKDPTPPVGGYGSPTNYRPERVRRFVTNERSIITAFYTRIAIDVASVKLIHAKVDDNEKYKETVYDGLNYCLNVEANLDQTGRAFFQAAVESMFDEGAVALVPTVTDDNPLKSHSFGIEEMRVAKVVEWFPKHVRVQIYNDITGKIDEMTLPKTMVAIVENPMYSIMNEPNSTLRRVMRKLAILDDIDEQSGSGKLDLIIQVPYSVKSPEQRKMVNRRKKDIEMQLAGSKYGIAYIDGTEHVTQLNRPVENNLMKQIEYLIDMLKSQLGLTDAILNGTANEQEMLNYYNRTVEPIISAFADEIKRKFLTKTARTQGHSIIYFRDPFKLVPVQNIADIADKFTRNEILSSNEIRTLVGFKPVEAKQANALENKNINQSEGAQFATTDGGTLTVGPDGGGTPVEGQMTQSQPTSPDDLQAIMNEMLDGLMEDIDKALGGK